MGQPKNTLVFALGCVGALAPEIVRLYKLRKKPPKEVFSWWYYVASVLLALLGGVVALVLPAITAWAAFYAGITTPMLVSTATKHRTKTIIALANEQRIRDNIIKATDHTDEIASASGKPKSYELQAKRAEISKISRFKTFWEFIQNHADGLFE